MSERHCTTCMCQAVAAASDTTADAYRNLFDYSLCGWCDEPLDAPSPGCPSPFQHPRVPA